MGFFEFIRSLFTAFGNVIDSVVRFLTTFLDGALSFLTVPVQFYGRFGALFVGYENTVVYGLQVLVFCGLGFIALRILINLL